jgi:hypothetical protein
MRVSLRGDLSALKAAMLDELKDRGAVADVMDQIGKILQDMKAAYVGDDDVDDDD